MDTYLFNKDGEALIFKGFGELDVLGSFVVYSQWGYNHVGQAPQELAHHAIPLFLVTVVHLRPQKESVNMRNQPSHPLSTYRIVFQGFEGLGLSPVGKEVLGVSYIREPAYFL